MANRQTSLTPAYAKAGAFYLELLAAVRIINASPPTFPQPPKGRLVRIERVECNKIGTAPDARAPGRFLFGGLLLVLRPRLEEGDELGHGKSRRVC
jgi:hypothetical protein